MVFKFTAVWFVMWLCLISVVAVAEQEDASQQTDPVNVMDLDPNPFERLGSGFSNIFLGLLEIPYHMNQQIAATNPVQGLVPGLLKGITRTIVREGVGVFELVTFFMPHEPILEQADTSWLHA
jgi:putative exosortase-associated protein (TIGR04073 family)